MAKAPVPLRIGQTIKNLNRVREIIQVLVKYGFEDLVANTPLQNFIPESRKLTWLRAARPVTDYSHAEMLRMATEELGSTFIKFAQVLSNRPDVLPMSIIKEFEKLQSSVPPFDIAEARAIIEKETGQKIETLFEYFLDKPIGSASIGQVHRAQLHDGMEVVVKVQRPGIRRVVENDLEIIHEIAIRGQSYFESLGIPNIVEIVEAFQKTMYRELDYRIEARSMAQFKSYYKGALKFKVPALVNELSTEKILVSEYISGVKITDVKNIISWGLEPERLAKKGIKLYLSQIFEYGLFHADPHPGNVLVMKDGRIALIDYGMVGQLAKKDKFAFAGIFIGLAQRDARQVATSLKQLAIEDGIANRKLFEHQLEEIIADFAGMDVRQGSMAELGTRLQRIIFDNKMKLPPSIFLILRAMAILEGIGKQISPDLNIYDLVRPLGVKMLKDQFEPENIYSELAYRLSSLDRFTQRIPNELISVLKTIRKGELEFTLQDAQRKHEVKQHSRATNRLITGILIAALFLGTCVLFTVEGPRMYDQGQWPIASIIGLSTTILLTVWLFWKALFNRRDL
ncbi:AarF/ABC1/UbiB kinase family protein [Chitinophagales bacterium]|nr:AarF/ABC1/UbiB kinase family protein [Chitinophagales bacterium]